MQTNEEKKKKIAKKVTPVYRRITKYHKISKMRTCVLLTSNATRILWGFTFLFKLGLLLFKTHWDYNIQIRKKPKLILV